MPCGYLGEPDGSVNPAFMDDEKKLLWNAPAYKRLGAMFWPDYWKTSPVNPIWAIIGSASSLRELL
jgi:alpha 1,2-mannosyltransferase